MLPEQILEYNNLQKTAIRLDILAILLSRNFAVPELELKELLIENYNRSTIYRTLQVFLQSKIIHKIVEEDGKFSYVASGKYKQTPHANKEHIHFKCQMCGTVMCLPDIPVGTYSLPKGYIKLKSNFLIVGVCNLCSQKK